MNHLMIVLYMKSKTKFVATLLFLITFGLVILEGCKKYSDGPALSLRSRSERVANTWKVENYKINGTDFTSLVSGYKESFTKKGAYYYNWGILDGVGTWVFQNSDKEIKLLGSDDQSSRTLFILKLEENTFWYYYMIKDDRHELHLMPY